MARNAMKEAPSYIERKGSALKNPDRALLQFAQQTKAKFFNALFPDVNGQMNWTTKPIGELEGALEDGVPFDGSSIPGFKMINESDMVAVLDPLTAIQDPFLRSAAISIICNVREPLGKEFFDYAPRTIALRAEALLRESGIADTAYFGPELEFFTFDDVRFQQDANAGFYSVDSSEGAWNTGRTEEGGNRGYKTQPKQGYYPMSTDKQPDMRMEMSEMLKHFGISVETLHHEVAAAQAEIDMRYDTLTAMADKASWYKYVIRKVAERHGKTATFMPKPLKGDNGSGMHVHMSLWKKGKPLFAGDGVAGLSEMGEHYAGGLSKHAKALCAFGNPLPNSYRRLVPGFEAPVNLAISAGNRSAALRVPTTNPSPKARRIEFRMPDPTANPYTLFPALLLAGLDGIKKKLKPIHTEEDLFEMEPEKLAKIPKAPGSLREALQALKEDHEFLTKDGVFSEEFIMQHIAMKEALLNDEVRSPTPFDFQSAFHA
jgi:glutamine synthetase